MLISLLEIFAGFVLLMGGAEYAVRGAVAIASKLNIPTLIIGLTIVALGTSVPEFVVSLSAALRGAPGISVGNVVGSNIANILLILGISAVICPVACHRSAFKREFGFMMLATIAMIAFSLNGVLVRWQGMVLLAVLAWFIYYNYRSSQQENTEETENTLARKGWTVILPVTLAGFAAILGGADLLVDGAVELARLLGVSEEIIGLTVIAFGTSLPELAASGMAAYRGHNDVAFGNIIGSNIWNIVFIMGATAVVTDVPVAAQIIRYDLWVMLAAAVILLVLMYRKCCLSRLSGAFLVLLYLLYIWSQVIISQQQLFAGAPAALA